MIQRKMKYWFLLQVLNLFLALLLSSFGASNLSAAGGGDDDTNKLSEAFSRIGRFIRWIKRMIFRAFKYFRDRLVDCFRQQLAARRGENKKFFILFSSLLSSWACRHLENAKFVELVFITKSLGAKLNHRSTETFKHHISKVFKLAYYADDKTIYCFSRHYTSSWCFFANVFKICWTITTHSFDFSSLQIIEKWHALCNLTELPKGKCSFTQGWWNSIKSAKSRPNFHFKIRRS